jgi:hypothetical protein
LGLSLIPDGGLLATALMDQLWDSLAVALLFIPASMMLMGGIAYVLGYAVFRGKGELIVQGGTSCPGCGYSLIGNTTMICPECGRGFTFDELATTEEEFRRRHRDVESQINTDERG